MSEASLGSELTLDGLTVGLQATGWLQAAQSPSDGTVRVRAGNQPQALVLYIALFLALFGVIASSPPGTPAPAP